MADALRGMLATSNRTGDGRVRPLPPAPPPAAGPTAPRHRPAGQSLVAAAAALVLVAAALLLYAVLKGRGPIGPPDLGLSPPDVPALPPARRCRKTSTRLAPSPHRPAGSSPSRHGGRPTRETCAAPWRIAGPGDTIRVLDAAAYSGPLYIGDRRWRGLTLEAPEGASLWAPGDRNAVLRIENTPGVTVRGFHIETGATQFAVRAGGDVAGLTLDDLSLAKPEPTGGPDGEGFAHVWLTGGAAARPPRRSGSAA